MIQINISNQSTLVSDVQLALWLPDLQLQIHRDFAPTWGIDATLVTSAAPEVDAYRVILQDEPDESGVLGYHLLDGNIPEARIFCRPTIADGDTVSSVLSHECLEMLADPLCQRMAVDGRHIVEVADPVEQNGYMIGETFVSNFVLPAYFRFNATGATTGFDFNGQLTAACPALLPGGYLQYWTGTQWEQTFARQHDGTLSWRTMISGRSAWRARKPPQ